MRAHRVILGYEPAETPPLPWLGGTNGLRGAGMGPCQPLTQLISGFVGRRPIKRHEGRRYAGGFDDTGPPAVGIDGCDLNQVRTAGNAFFKTANGDIHRWA